MTAEHVQFSFSDGVLHIPSRLARMRLQWQPRPLAEELLPGHKKWRPFWPEFRLLAPIEKRSSAEHAHFNKSFREMIDSNNAALAAFRSEVPQDIVAAVERFPSHQWSLMVLLADQPLAMDLARDNPVVLYALANSYEFRKTSPDVSAQQVRGHSFTKQRSILKWLGFPDTEAVVRLLRKIEPAGVSPSVLRCFRNVLNGHPDMIKRLSHLPKINRQILVMLVNVRTLELSTPKLLKELAGLDEMQDGGMVYADIVLNALQICADICPSSRRRAFESIAQITRFRVGVDAMYMAFFAEQERRKEVAERRRRQREERREEAKKLRRRKACTRFPDPPIPGTDHICPITTPAELVEEGRCQQHCVGGYIPQIRGGMIYVYKVTAPERATLAIVCDPDGCWRRSELALASNQRVGHETTRMVDMWLRQYIWSA